MLGMLLRAGLPRQKAFEEQLHYEAVECPHCQSTVIVRNDAANNTGSQMTPDVDDKSNIGRFDIRDMLFGAISTEFYHELRKHFENVGNRFTDVVRKMHAGNAGPKKVRGFASMQDIKQLQKEGIECFYIPSNKNTNSNDNTSGSNNSGKKIKCHS